MLRLNFQAWQKSICTHIWIHGIQSANHFVSFRHAFADARVQYGLHNQVVPNISIILEFCYKYLATLVVKIGGGCSLFII